jgi:hypothetical protein
LRVMDAIELSLHISVYCLDIVSERPAPIYASQKEPS